MSNLREAAQQALEALDAYSWEQVDAARTALRAALEQQVEPEPVAWMVVVDGGTSAYVTDNPTDFVMDNPDYPESAYRALPLYTAPPQRKPLTDAEIEKLFGGAVADVPRAHWLRQAAIEVVRKTERAHGIGEGE